MSRVAVATAVALTGLLIVNATCAQSDAYADGLADRTAYENWFATLAPPEQAGAEYWASQRSLRNPGPCARTTHTENDRRIEAGCREAQRRLAPTDARRLSEPDYRKGWNAFQEVPYVASVATPIPLPITPPPPPPVMSVSPRPAFAGDGYAQQNVSNFTADDLPLIVETSRNNEIRFDRDYKGKVFSSPAIFGGASESLFRKGTYMLKFKVEGGYEQNIGRAAKRRVQCCSFGRVRVSYSYCVLQSLRQSICVFQRLCSASNNTVKPRNSGQNLYALLLRLLVSKRMPLMDAFSRHYLSTHVSEMFVTLGTVQRGKHCGRSR